MRVENGALIAEDQGEYLEAFARLHRDRSIQLLHLPGMIDEETQERMKELDRSSRGISMLDSEREEHQRTVDEVLFEAVPNLRSIGDAISSIREKRLSFQFFKPGSSKPHVDGVERIMTLSLCVKGSSYFGASRPPRKTPIYTRTRQDYIARGLRKGLLQAEYPSLPHAATLVQQSGDGVCFANPGSSIHWVKPFAADEHGNHVGRVAALFNID